MMRRWRSLAILLALAASPSAAFASGSAQSAPVGHMPATCLTYVANESGQTSLTSELRKASPHQFNVEMARHAAGRRIGSPTTGTVALLGPPRDLSVPCFDQVALPGTSQESIVRVENSSIDGRRRMRDEADSFNADFAVSSGSNTVDTTGGLSRVAASPALALLALAIIGVAAVSRRTNNRFTTGRNA